MVLLPVENGLLLDHVDEVSAVALIEAGRLTVKTSLYPGTYESGRNELRLLSRFVPGEARSDFCRERLFSVLEPTNEGQSFKDLLLESDAVLECLLAAEPRVSLPSRPSVGESSNSGKDD